MHNHPPPRPIHRHALAILDQLHGLRDVDDGGEAIFPGDDGAVGEHAADLEHGAMTTVRP